MRAVMRKAFPRTVPVLAGYIFLGIAYGVAMKARGFGILWSGLISLTVFGGSMQFALIEPLTQAFAPLTVAALTVLVQARHLFYGLSMLEEYSTLGRCRLYNIFALSDETYSLVCTGAPRGVDRGQWYTAVSLMDQSYWVLGTLLGALLGAMLPTDALTGIDFAMTALFTVIVTEQCMDSARQVKAGTMDRTEAAFAPALGGGATLVCLLLAGRDSFLLPAMGVMLAGFLARWLLAERGRTA